MKKETIELTTKEQKLEGLLIKYSSLVLKYSSREIPLTEFDQGKVKVMKDIQKLFK